MSNADKSEDCLNIANSLIAQCNLLVPPISHVAEINSNLIVLLYEKITGLLIPDFKTSPVEEADVIQAVINALSLDILQLSLSHITGEAVTSGDVVAIHNLLHVLKAILLHSNAAENVQQTFPKQKISRFKNRDSRISKESICKEAISSSPLDIEKVFEMKVERMLIENSHSLKSKSSLIEKNRLQHTTESLKKSSYPRPCDKSYLLPYTLRSKHERHPPPKNGSAKKRESHQEKERMHEAKSTLRTGFIQELLDEFPCIQISQSMMKNIEKMYTHQLLRMHKLIKKCLLEKRKTRIEAESISKRQLKLNDMLKKDVLQQQYLNKIKEEKENERKIKYSLRDSRLKSAKMKQYTDEFIKEMRKKMLKTNTNEEQIFKRVFKEVMDIQSEHVNYLCRQVKEARINDDEQYLNYLISLENLYQSQYLALSEEIATERNNAHLRLNAERQVLERTNREFRERLMNEIRFMQGVIVEQTEDAHFRELDADRYVNERRRQLR